MTKEGQNFADIARNLPPRQARSLDHHHGKAERARGIKLGARSFSAGVLGDDDVDPAAGQKRGVCRHIKWSAGDHNLGIGQWKCFDGRVDKPQQIVVLRFCREGPESLAPDRKEDAARRVWQRGNRPGKITDHGPSVAGARCPRRALERAKPYLRLLAGRDRIAAHHGGERVGRIDDMGDFFGAKIAHKAVDAVKAADTGRKRLRKRRLGSPGVGIDGVETTFREAPGQDRRFCRAAEKKDARHV